MPTVGVIVELSPSHVRDFGNKAVEDFQIWIEERYGSISHLNETWDSQLSSFDAIDPVNQENDIFYWESSDPSILRSCDDFTEFTLERFVGGWLRIRAEVLKRKKVCFAVENIAPIRYSQSNSKVPLYRINDFADILIQRHGFVESFVADRIRYSSMHKAGKYVVFAGMKANSWQFYSLNALITGGNPGTYTWNECYDISGIIFKISTTNNAKKYIETVASLSNPLNNNGGFEVGINRYLPNWKASRNVARITEKAYLGNACLQINGSDIQTTLLSNTMTFTPSKAHALLFFVCAEGEVNLEDSININAEIGSETLNVYLDDTGWHGNPDSFIHPDIHDITNQWHIIDATANPKIPSPDKQKNSWVAFTKLFNTNTLSGTQQLKFSIDVKPSVTLYIDGINFIELQ